MKIYPKIRTKNLPYAMHLTKLFVRLRVYFHHQQSFPFNINNEIKTMIFTVDNNETHCEKVI